MKKTTFVTGSVMAITLLAAGSVLAHGIKNPYERRHEAMHAIAGSMKALGAVAKGEAEADAGTPVHARNIKALAVVTPLMFPEGSTGGKSRAKAEIWSDWDGFVKASDDFYAAANGLVDAAKSGDAGKIGAALGAVGKTCGGCHKPYRGPKVAIAETDH